jgi:hypothetical protein
MDTREPTRGDVTSVENMPGRPAGDVTYVAQKVQHEIERPRTEAQIAFARVATALAAMATGALAIGTFAIGALAIRRLAIKALALGRARVGKLVLDEVEIGRLVIRERPEVAVTRSWRRAS